MTTIDVPVVGKVKSTYVYVGGALLVGVVGYAWLSRGQSSAPVEDPGGVSYPDGVTPTVVDSNIDATGNDVIDTNSEWTQKAVEYVVSLGFDGGFAGTALGKYLARRALTTQEQDVVLAAVGGLDQPPVGRPYTIMSTPVPVIPPVTTPQTRTWTHGYKVKSGDTWASVAKRYRVSQTDLWNHNPSLRRSPPKLQAGWVMLVPTG